MEGAVKPAEAVKYRVHQALIKRLIDAEEKARQVALELLRDRLNKYTLKHDLRQHLAVDEEKAPELAEAHSKEPPRFRDTSYGTKAYATLQALGERTAFGRVVGY